MIGDPVESDRPRLPTQPQRYDDPSTWPELLEPGRRDVPSRHRHHDLVVRRSARRTELPVGPQYDDVVVPGLIEQRPRPLGHLGIDVDRRHSSARTGQVPQQRRVVATRTDFEHPVPRPDRGLLEHQRDDARLRHRADHHPGVVALHEYDVVGVRDVERRVRNEQVPRHRPERGRHPLVMNGAFGN
jgi:hypothetical protein